MKEATKNNLISRGFYITFFFVIMMIDTTTTN